MVGMAVPMSPVSSAEEGYLLLVTDSAAERLGLGDTGIAHVESYEVSDRGPRPSRTPVHVAGQAVAAACEEDAVR